MIVYKETKAFKFIIVFPKNNEYPWPKPFKSIIIFLKVNRIIGLRRIIEMAVSLY